MQKIEQVKGQFLWNDCLNGVALVDGQKLAVQWPDGSVEMISIHVVSREVVESFHVQTEAYFISKYHGRDTWARLLGVPAKSLTAG